MRIFGSLPVAPLGRQILVDSPMPSRIGTSTAFSESAIADSSLRSPSSLYRVRSCAEAADATTRAAISRMVENDFFITWLPCNDPRVSHARSEEHTSELQSLMRIS